MTPIEYQRHRHAAHYGNGRGHDLELWHVRQAIRDARPACVPSDAEYHSGFVRDGEQWKTYARRAELSGGACRFCKSRAS